MSWNERPGRQNGTLIWLGVSVVGSNYIHGDAIVWKASRQTVVLEGGGGHIEAHGYSLITTVSHRGFLENDKFLLPCCHGTVILCGKIIAMSLWYDYDTVVFCRLVFIKDATLSCQSKIII